MSRDLSTYSPEFQAFVRSICGCRRGCEPVAFNQYSCALVESPFKSPQQQMAGTSKPRAECVPGCMAVVSAKTGAEQRAQEQYPEFPQHPAEAAEREEDLRGQSISDDGRTEPDTSESPNSAAPEFPAALSSVGYSPDAGIAGRAGLTESSYFYNLQTALVSAGGMA